jgi:hypothetical protein
VGWGAEARTVVAEKKVSGCNRTTNSLRTIVYHGKCGEKHCWHLRVLAFGKKHSCMKRTFGTFEVRLAN